MRYLAPGAALLAVAAAAINKVHRRRVQQAPLPAPSQALEAATWDLDTQEGIDAFVDSFFQFLEAGQAPVKA
jgi:hypothetical protein